MSLVTLTENTPEHIDPNVVICYPLGAQNRYKYFFKTQNSAKSLCEDPDTS